MMKRIAPNVPQYRGKSQFLPIETYSTSPPCKIEDLQVFTKDFFLNINSFDNICIQSDSGFSLMPSFFRKNFFVRQNIKKNLPVGSSLLNHTLLNLKFSHLSIIKSSGKEFYDLHYFTRHEFH